MVVDGPPPQAERINIIMNNGISDIFFKYLSFLIIGQKQYIYFSHNLQ